MKIAVTADAHLTSRDVHPERFSALESVFSQSLAMGIQQVILAGDTFDRDTQDCSELDALCSLFPDLHFNLLPGNHDSEMTGRKLKCPNVSVYTEPECVIMDTTCLLFVPFEKNCVMGSRISSMAQLIEGKRWVLVGHGDHHGGIRQRNPYEPGTYMPLSASDIKRFKPLRVFLGHIHRPTDDGIVHYPGSPCGLDINETGPRRFIVFDMKDGSVTSHPVKTDVIYFNESFVVLPGEFELDRLVRDIRERTAAWGIEPTDAEKVRLRVRVTGFSSDLKAVRKAIQKEFGDYTMHDSQGPDMSGLRFSDDSQLNAIAEKTRSVIEELQWDFGGDEPDREMVIEEALRVIYSEEGP